MNNQEQEQQKENKNIEEEKTNNSPYEIKVKQSNKQGLKQPRCVEDDILPKAPIGILAIGRSGSGKTNAVVNMLDNELLLKGYFQDIYMMTDTNPDETLIKDLKLKKENIISDFTEEDVKKILNENEKIIEQKGFNKSRRILLVFDDILSNQKFLKSKTATKLASANRHYNVSYIMCSQYFKKVPPVIRTNARYYILFASSMNETEKMAEELCCANMSKKQFIKYFQHATRERYSFMTINTESECPLRRLFDNILL